MSSSTTTKKDHLKSAWSSFWKALALQIVLGWPLVTDGTPRGILDLELARRVERTREILDECWSSSPPYYLPAAVVLTDYWFVLAYMRLLLVLLRAHVMARNDDDSDNKPPLFIRNHHETAVWLGYRACQCVFGAGVLDGIENSCLLWQMFRGAGSRMSAVAFWAASIKFALLPFPILLLVVHWMVRRLAMTRV